MSEIVSIILLGLIVIGQGVERYFYSKEMNKQLANATKAVMSRNINEYLAATAPEKPKQGFTETDEIELSNASEEEFDKHIKGN